jgi:hypothetical protein
MPVPTPRQARTNTAPLLATRSAVRVALPAVGEPKGNGAVKVYNWGDNNLLPQELLALAYDSGTAEACLRILAQFIGGEGFVKEETGKAMANPEQNFNELLAEAKHYAALGIGVTFGLRFDLNGESPDIYVLEAECVRRERDGLGRYVLNDRLAHGKMPIADNRLYLPFHRQADSAQIAEEVNAAADAGNYWGHLWWSFEGRVGRRRYPWPSWHAAKEDVEADAQLPRYDLKQIKNGFMPDLVMTLVGDKYNDVPDDRWEPGTDETEEDRPYVKSPDRIAVEATIRALKGAASESSVMLNTVETQEEMPQLDWVDKGPNSKGLTDMRNRIEGAVYRRFGVPPELAGVATAGVLGNNQQIVNLISFFNLRIAPDRALITGPLSHLRPDLDFTVKPLNPITYLDPLIAAKLTPDEIRAIGGYAPLPPATPAPTPQPAAQ